MSAAGNASRSTLRVLLLEDNPLDAEIILHELRLAGFDPGWTRVDTEDAFRRELETPPELILADYNLPQFDGMSALRLLRAGDLDIPFILISGSVGEETAVAAIKEGADDYLLKDRLARLGPAVANALDARRLRSERRQAEEQMRLVLAALDATDEAVFIFDPDTMRHSYVNDGAVRQVGYTRAELLAMSAFDIKPELDKAHCQTLLAPLLRGQVRTRHVTTVHRHKDGRDIPVEINMQYLPSEAAQPCFISIARDISERVQMERQVSRSQRLEAIGTLAGGVAHDLNNALAPILMGTELLRMDYPGESELIDAMHTSARRGADMVRQLVTFARGAEGQRVSVQTRHLLKEMEQIVRHTFPKDIQVISRYDADLPTVYGDATQIHQILLNLCVNARDAMPDGGTLTLDAQSADVDTTYASAVLDALPGRYVMLRVHDTGTGIPSEILDRIFDPFFTTKDPDRGTGLGLSTVMGIVKGHGGFLQVSSEPGEGTAFRVYLPRDQSGRDTDGAQAGDASPRGRGETILFVDDEPAVRSAARLALQQLNFKVLTAADGADGLIQVVEHRAELSAVITNIEMPHMDGVTFIKMLRRMLPALPVVIASGRIDDRTVEAMRQLGVTHRVDKPFTEAELARVLAAVLSGRQEAG